MITHGSIVPLIGGMTLAQEEAFGTPPSLLVSYEPFVPNESHLLNWYKYKGVEVPYHLLDRDGPTSMRTPTVMNSTCPCAGLSFMHSHYGTNNPNNKWMLLTSEYVLGTMKPDVFWGENSPHLAGNVGKEIRETMYKTARNNGYTMSLYTTKSILHGNPQVRARSFYFFWKGDKIPIFKYFRREHQTIEDCINSVRSNFQMESHNPKRPSDDPYYQYILKEIHGGIDHKKFATEVFSAMAPRSNDVMSYIEHHPDHGWGKLIDWLRANGYEKEADKCVRRKEKTESGKNIMRRGTIIPKKSIGAFVGHYPGNLAHPTEDRYVTYREMMTVMGLPQDFELLNPKDSVNHICQNVPLGTARDMSDEVLAYLRGERETVRENMLIQHNQKMSYEIADTGERATLEGLI